MNHVSLLHCIIFITLLHNQMILHIRTVPNDVHVQLMLSTVLFSIKVVVHRHQVSQALAPRKALFSMTEMSVQLLLDWPLVSPLIPVVRSMTSQPLLLKICSEVLALTLTGMRGSTSWDLHLKMSPSILWKCAVTILLP